MRGRETAVAVRAEHATEQFRVRKPCKEPLLFFEEFRGEVSIFGNSGDFSPFLREGLANVI